MIWESGFIQRLLAFVLAFIAGICTADHHLVLAVLLGLVSLGFLFLQFGGE